MDTEQQLSLAGLDLLNDVTSKVYALDKLSRGLLQRMRPAEGYVSRLEVNRSEYVPGNISVFLPDLSTIELTVTLDKTCSKVLGQDVYDRVVRHALAFCREQNRKLAVKVEVLGSTANLQMSNCCHSK